MNKNRPGIIPRRTLLLSGLGFATLACTPQLENSTASQLPEKDTPPVIPDNEITRSKVLLLPPDQLREIVSQQPEDKIILPVAGQWPVRVNLTERVIEAKNDAWGGLKGQTLKDSGVGFEVLPETVVVSPIDGWAFVVDRVENNNFTRNAFRLEIGPNRGPEQKYYFSIAIGGDYEILGIPKGVNNSIAIQVTMGQPLVRILRPRGFPPLPSPDIKKDFNSYRDHVVVTKNPFARTVEQQYNLEEGERIGSKLQPDSLIQQDGKFVGVSI